MYSYFCLILDLSQFIQSYLSLSLSLFISISLNPFTTLSGCSYLSILVDIQGAYNKFTDFLRMGTFIDSTHMKL